MYIRVPSLEACAKLLKQVPVSFLYELHLKKKKDSGKNVPAVSSSQQTPLVKQHMTGEAHGHLLQVACPQL